MSLRDTACYTLSLIPSLADPTVVELVETLSLDRQEARYARVREKRDGEVYSSIIYDAFLGAQLASCGYVLDKSKSRRLQLYGPDVNVPFDFTGRLGFEWTFQFEENKFKWTRAGMSKDYVCSLDRRPDPSVEICLARDSDKNSPGKLQILHYNIERFPNEIKDLRGLETLLVASLMCLIDASEDRQAAVNKPPTPQRPPVVTSTSSSSSLSPPKPPTPVRIISEEDFEPENPNEIIVGLNTSIDGHISRAVGLLEDPSVLFIVIRTKSPGATQRALEVSLGVTRYRHRESLSDLHQYVIEEEDIRPPVPPRPGPKVIKLDAETNKPSSESNKGTKNWTPPSNISIYLSTIELPDLKPGRREALRKGAHGATASTAPTKTPSPSPPTGGGSTASSHHNGGRSEDAKSRLVAKLLKPLGG